MPEVECRTRRIGGSLGIILPKDAVESNDIKENEKIIIEIKRRHKAKEFFGLAHDWKTPTQELKNEERKGW